MYIPDLDNYRTMSIETPKKKALHHEDIEVAHTEAKPEIDSETTQEINSEPNTGAEKAQETVEEGLSESDKTIQAEAEKTENLGVLDFKARELAREDREAADQLLLRMKDRAFSRAVRTLETEEKYEASARDNLEKAIDVGQEGRILNAKDKIPEAFENWEKVNSQVMEMEGKIVRSAAEGLAREKNPIAKSDPEGEGKKTAATFASGMLAPFVRLIPASWFRDGK